MSCRAGRGRGGLDLEDMARVSSFIRSYIHDDAGRLGDIYRQAVSDGVPVIRPETRELLKTQLLLTKPLNILEIGTAVGYSALFMLQYAPENAHVTTIELSADRVRDARGNIESLNRQEQITVLQGDAAEVLAAMDGSFDFAFVDAAKAQYIAYLPEVMRLVRQGGLIVSDNVLQDGEVLESHFTVAKRDRTIHDRMRAYLYELCNNGQLETAILSVGDGVALSVRL